MQPEELIGFGFFAGLIANFNIQPETAGQRLYYVPPTDKTPYSTFWDSLQWVRVPYLM